MLLCAGVEVDGAVPSLRIIHANTREAAPHVLDRDAFVPALATHAEIKEWPTYQCLGPMLAVVEQESRDLQSYAAEVQRPVHGVRAGRQTTSYTWEELQWQPLQTRAGTIAFYARGAARPAARELPPRRSTASYVYDHLAVGAQGRARLRLCLDSPGGCKLALELLGLGGDARLRVAANGRDFGDVLVAGGSATSRSRCRT